MDISVVIPTLNGRDRLATCLDALAERAPGIETVVANGPSADGTSGMVRDRDEVDVLVELDERNVNVARNAGAARASGDIIAFLGDELVVDEGWMGALRERVPGVGTDAGTDTDAPVATDGGAETAGEAGTEPADDDGDGAEPTPPVGAISGPTNRQLRAGVATEEVETRRIKGRSVTYVNPRNVAFTQQALHAIDGFDEYLEVGGARDAAHRLAATGFGVDWRPAMSVRFDPDRGPSPRADGGDEADWRWRYRSLTYRLVKNYGPRPTVAYRVCRHAVDDAWDALREVGRGEARPSTWFGNGRDVTLGTGRGLVDGIRARYGDRSPRRNPRGISSRTDRAVTVFDRR
ncbi:glycosyltransferase family 2 protein [Haloglomus litoreum]|uniref:glycosyltransferase family 2 protein n=1 Tax=Haloglomus litoreum TaxID=3034026 RepID=UPI0023E7BBA1|nr:glycosyltransferase [Haloglomus sp. DT116]